MTRGELLDMIHRTLLLLKADSDGAPVFLRDLSQRFNTRWAKVCAGETLLEGLKSDSRFYVFLDKERKRYVINDAEYMREQKRLLEKAFSDL